MEWFDFTSFTAGWSLAWLIAPFVFHWAGKKMRV